MNFFFVISKEDPAKIKAVKIENSSEPSKMDIEQMERSLDMINMWIGNCDQKASFLLAFVGVAATIIITNNVIAKIKELLVVPFVTYWKEDVGAFSTSRFIFAACIIISLVSTISSLVNLLLCLMAKTDYSKFMQQNMESKSLFFYKHIASMTYSEFCLAKNDKYNDLRSQIYTNACICTNKFRYYKIGVTSIMVAIPFGVLAFIIILFL